MAALARSAGRAPTVIGFLLLSLAAHLAVLRGASLPGWYVPGSPQPPAVSVTLLVPAAPLAAVAPPAPAPVARPRARPAPRRPAPRAAARAPTPSAAAPQPARTESTGPQPPAFDAFGSPIGPTAAADGADAEAAGAVAQPIGADDAHAPGAGDASATADAGADEATAPPAVTESSQEPAAPPIVVTPQAGSVRYVVHYGDPADGNVVATLEQSFDIGPDRYLLHSEGRAQGLTSWFYRGTLVQDSVGSVSGSGLSPSSYREQRGDRRPRTVTLDAEKREVVFASGARREAPAGVQDRLSAMVQLALMRRSRPALFEPGATIALPVIGNSRVEAANWRVLGEEEVATHVGPVTALRLNRAPAANNEPTIDVWLALDARIVPVRMRITEAGGRALDQVLASQ